MKFLICGLGSIGQRHVRMIRGTLNGDADIAAYRSRNLDFVVSDGLEATFGRKPEEYYGIRAFRSFQEALSWKPDAVFVTNPTSMHIATAIEAAKAGCHIFIEKPLAHDERELSELSQIVSEKQLVCMIGYQLRYHPSYVHIKALLEQNAIGPVTSADLYCGEWLPGMHPYEDYRQSYAARQDLGGGAILCLSHEMDIACWLFGKPRAVRTAGGHFSDLQMDVEDTADISLCCARAGREFEVRVHLDFIQKPARRHIHIAGENGSIAFDYHANEGEVRLLRQGETQRIASDRFERNGMFRQEVSEFIDCIRNRTRPRTSLEDGIATLRICLAAKRSLASGKTEVLS